MSTVVHIYGDQEPINLPLEVQQGIVASLTVLLFILMALEASGPEVLFFIALMICCLTQILTLGETLSGFANESMITIGTLFLVIGAVEKSHIVDWLARKTFGSSGSELVGKFRMYVTCFLLSIFFNNTPLVAILLPVVKDWGRMRGIAASQLLIPLSYSVLAGSFGSMIGTSTNLTVQGLMSADRGYSFSFFAPLPIGIACFTLLLIYILIASPYLLPTNKSGLLRKARDELKEYIAEVFVSEHSIAVGNSLEFMMSSLGLAPSYAVKIRRRKNPTVIFNNEKEKTIKPSPSFVDVNYFKDTAKFWYSKSNIPDRLDGYTPTSQQGDMESAGKALKEEYFDIISPSFHEVINAGDVVFVASAHDAVEKMMKSILGESRGLYILQGNVLSLPGFGTELVELVLSDSNPYIGCRLSDVSSEFGERYKAAIITLRAKDFGKSLANEQQSYEEEVLLESHDIKAVASMESISNTSGGSIELVDMSTVTPVEDKLTKEEEYAKKAKQLFAEVVISEHLLAYGDTLLVVTKKENVEELSHNRDFFVVSGVGNLPVPLDWYSLIPVVIFIAMLCLVAAELIDMCPAALAVTAVFFMGGWIKPHDIPKMIDIRLLMLMGCSLSFAKAMTKSGLALKIAASIGDSNPSNFGALMLIYAVTLVITELISNNAAAALMYPIAVALADELGVSFKPFAMAVVISSTAGFMSPIGYQTHVMVWGPGGYKFKDFLLFGMVPDLIYWFVGCAIAAQLYPF